MIQRLLSLCVPVAIVAGGVFGIELLGDPPSDKAVDPWFQANVLSLPGPVVVQFGAAWCPSCRALHSALGKASNQFTRTRFVHIDVEEYPDVFERFGSGRAVPQLVVFRQGRAMARLEGFGGEEFVLKWLDARL
jgi:thioredoxin 1